MNYVTRVKTVLKHRPDLISVLFEEGQLREDGGMRVDSETMVQQIQRSGRSPGEKILLTVAVLMWSNDRLPLPLHELSRLDSQNLAAVCETIMGAWT